MLGAGRFNFTVVNSYDIKSLASSPAAAPYSACSFGAVYRSQWVTDARTVPLMASGLITEINTSFRIRNAGTQRCRL